MSENILILGATSGIAQALCQRLAGRGCQLILAARDRSQLEPMAADLRIRYGTQVFVEPFDALDFAGHAALVDRCVSTLNGELDGVVLCYGYLPDQRQAETDFAETRRAIDINFTSAASLLDLVAARLASRGRGFIAAISSVAGDRGRQSNYVYGSAKAGLTVYLAGLRNRLFQSGVHVLTIKPGFVDTPMTQGVINPKSPLVASPERVARDIDRAIRKQKDVIYTPWFWWGIMLIIRSIPEFVFKRLKL